MLGLEQILSVLAILPVKKLEMQSRVTELNVGCVLLCVCIGQILLSQDMIMF